jgi:hypothetical protein
MTWVQRTRNETVTVNSNRNLAYRLLEDGGMRLLENGALLVLELNTDFLQRPRNESNFVNRERNG